MRGRGQHRAEHGVIGADRARTREIGGVVTGRAEPLVLRDRPLLQLAQHRAGGVETRGVEARDVLRIAVENRLDAALAERARHFAIRGVTRRGQPQAQQRIRHERAGLARLERRRRKNELRRQAQRVHDRRIGREQLPARQFAGGNPRAGRMLAGDRFTLERGDQPGIEVHRQFGVHVPQADQRPGRGHPDAELLAQLADERLLHGLKGLHLAAGKFPLARVELVGGPLADQDFAARVAQGAGGDVQEPHLNSQVRYSALIFTYS